MLIKGNKSIYELELYEYIDNIKQSDKYTQEMTTFELKGMYSIEHEFPLIKILSEIYIEKYNIKFNTFTGYIDFSMYLYLADEHHSMDEIKDIYFENKIQDGCYIFE